MRAAIKNLLNHVKRKKFAPQKTIAGQALKYDLKNLQKNLWLTEQISGRVDPYEPKSSSNLEQSQIIVFQSQTFSLKVMENNIENITD